MTLNHNTSPITPQTTPTDETIANFDTHIVPIANQNPQQIGPYRIKEEIGRGAMGRVYLAEHVRLKRNVALKVVPPEFTVSKKQLDRFHREMEAVGRLDHPNIVRATDAGEFSGIHYLAMEFVAGVDLAKWLRHVGTFSVGCASELVRQAAIGLTHIRESSLVHRDIKPANLLVTKSGTVKILDLGIAMLRQGDGESSMTSAGALMGTPDFIAPEQIERVTSVDSRADIYSLGCTFYALLTGRPPFVGPDLETDVAKMMAHARQPAPVAHAIRPDVPVAVSQIVEKMMAKDPADRYQTPQDVVVAVTDWASLAELKALISNGHPSTDGRTSEADTSVVSGTRLPSPVGQAGNLSASARFRTRYQSVLRRHWLMALVALAIVIGLAVAPKLVPDSNRAAIDRPPLTRPLTPTSQIAAPSGAAADRVIPTALDQIASDTNQIRRHTERLSATNEGINQNTRRIAESLEQLRESFAAAARAGGIIAEPASAGEYYHNARIYESTGRAGLARTSYVAMLAAGADYVDVHQRFQQLLKLQEGVPGARAVYRTLPPPADPLVREFAHACLEDLPERELQLAAILERAPDFSPAIYELSRCASHDLLGDQTMADKAREKQSLERFFQSLDEAPFLRYFLDQSAAAAWVEDGRHRLNALASFEAEFADLPVDLVFARFRQGWSVTFQIKETPREIFYRLDAEHDMRSTGFTEQIDRVTHRPHPVTVVTLPASTPACTIEVSYVDVRGIRRGPFQIPFDPSTALLAHAKRELNARRQSWAIFGRGAKSNRVNFAYLSKFAEVISSVHYGVGRADPDQEIDVTNPATLTVTVPNLVTFVVVQVTFSDGSQSEIVRIQR